MVTTMLASNEGAPGAADRAAAAVRRHTQGEDGEAGPRPDRGHI